MRIDPCTLYTRQSLAELLGSAIDVDLFIATVRPRKITKRLFFGEHILEALRDVDDEHPEPLTSASLKQNSGAKLRALAKSTGKK